MTRTIVVTGAASGIGAAARERLERGGHRVIGVDLRNSDIDADLDTVDGRTEMVAQVTRLAPDGIDGVLAGAGISRPGMEAQTIGINFFGAVATLEGLRPLLAKSARPRAVAICSTAALLPSNRKVVELCLSGDEAGAREAMLAEQGNAYSTSKNALSLWLRRAAVQPEWGGEGILLNGIGPGVINTPMTRPLFDQPEMVELMKQSNPMAVKNYAEPGEVAELIDFLLGMENHYLVGQIIFIDGGSDAILRPENF
ncbi:putative oxidoreductase [Sphingobium herbicidovorans NBRC 16415]|uniref:Oxidoreductase n=1 Tax=Sphingobium herbicidovorans (strain ATCC 700291 / DSM 11019 / CCUG 56400 / KCTC 2939 / LMG 18315 / NBRC 16415 / MH) TaxID=1219045 RepID=A0A086P644_SPHHM|nr:SDR family oxidoreductase [Sphingobium herbicidovorans]KFG88862.1 putative oxidoreductase [Sphingobium herbicidovorans NBRC 16415]